MIRKSLNWFSGRKGRGAGFTLMSAGNFLAALFTYLRQAEIARLFGTTWKTDAFAVSLVFPVLVREIVSHSIGATFLPIYADVRRNRGEEKARKLVNRLLTWVVIAGILISVMLVILSRKLVFAAGPGLSPDSLDLASSMLKLMVPVLVLSVVSGILQGLCNFQRRFGLTSLLRVTEIGVSLGAVLFLSGAVGIMVLPLSVLAGSVGMFVTVAIIAGRLHHRYHVELNPVDSDFGRQLRMALPIVAGSIFALLGPVADRILASFLRESSVTALDYASRIVKIIFSILLMPISVLANVSLSTISSLGSLVPFRKELRSLLNWNSSMMVPGAIFLMVLSVPLVSTLFQRGEFTEESTRLVGYALIFYAPWLASFSFSSILNRAFFALKDAATPVLVGVWGMIVNVLLNVILIVDMGIGGLALATSITSVAKVVLLWRLLAGKTGGFHGIDILKEHARIAVSTASMAGSLILLMKLLPFSISGNLPGRLALLCVYGVTALAVYCLVMLATGSDVLRSVRGKIDGLRGGRGDSES